MVGGDGNLLLDVGPMPDGRIEPRQANGSRKSASWLAKYGESIYGTRGGPFERGDWGAATYKDDTIYLHLLDANMDVVKLAPLARKIVGNQVLTGGDGRGQTNRQCRRGLGAQGRPATDRHDCRPETGRSRGGGQVQALGHETTLHAAEDLRRPETRRPTSVKAVFFEGPPWKGKPTRVFAYYGVPKSKNGEKAPAIVLVHGGGGSASLSG